MRHADSYHGKLRFRILLGLDLIPFFFAVGAANKERDTLAAVENSCSANVAPAKIFAWLTPLAKLNDLGPGLNTSDPGGAAGAGAANDCRHFFDAQLIG